MQGKQYVTLGGFILRFLLIIYGNWQDENHEVGFTDVDYKVFTDAAQNILQNQSPYTQPTYRYSPLIALLLTPNIILFQQFGKLIFCCVDLIVGQQIYWYAKKCLSATEKNALIMQSLWVFNVPFVGVISSRGNSDSIAVMLILGMLQLAQRGFLMEKVQDNSLALQLDLRQVFQVYYICFILCTDSNLFNKLIYIIWNAGITDTIFQYIFMEHIYKQKKKMLSPSLYPPFLFKYLQFYFYHTLTEIIYTSVLF
eukprot:TRINITY_DN1277_c0_g2_i2.p1 TRINITY_DN1277_c0_g2~~TRINITY_DN1277_c0_g2_i2.p1  ORF type:complete len:278 (-),score=22.16 TRINITY_DN1277_c0_g2_i2:308-1069(-)